MSPEALEAILVQRHQLAKDLETGIRESILTDKKHFYLLLGTRGIGKTHLVALTYHRIAKMEDLRDKLVIAWLREEEWGVTSFLDLLLRIFRALQGEYPQQYATELDEKVEALYQLSASEAELVAADILREFVGEKTLLLLTENLDDLFDGLGEVGQKRFREYIQKYGFFTILATAQSMFDGVLQNDAPFYEFFQVHQLEELTLEQARQLLRNIARQEEKKDLEEFILTPTGRDRISAINHLAAGNPRVYVIFSQFLTRKSLDELVEPFMKMLDDLTPYYQARMSWLSQQQRKIIEFLTESRHAVSVKEIAQRCFASHQTASSQLKDLRGKGYVRSETIGRESFYELREPLMRICLEVKKQKGKPIKLFMDFLKIWYTKKELEQRLEFLPNESIEREYILYVLQQIELENNYLDSITVGIKIRNYFLEGNFIEAAQELEKIAIIKNLGEDWLSAGTWWLLADNLNQALLCYNKSLEIDSNNSEAWIFRGIALKQLGYNNEALNSCNKAIEIKPDSIEAWIEKGHILSIIEHYEEALSSFNKAIEIDPLYLVNPTNISHNLVTKLNDSKGLKLLRQSVDGYGISFWHDRGYALFKLTRYEEALESFDQAIKLDHNYVPSWNMRGKTLSYLEHYEEALLSFNKSIELKPDDPITWYHKALVLIGLEQYNEALKSCLRIIDLGISSSLMWKMKGWLLYQVKSYEESVQSLKQAIELGESSLFAFVHIGLSLLSLNQWKEGILALTYALQHLGNEEKMEIEYTKVIISLVLETSNNKEIWKNRIKSLLELYSQYNITSDLAIVVIDIIPKLMSELDRDKLVQNWLEVWQELAGNIPEFQIPLKLLDTAVRYRLSKEDRRVLLELPIEERKILQQVLKLEES